MPRKATPSYRTLPRYPEGKLTHKIPVLFTEEEAARLLRRAKNEDRSASNLIHYVVRQYLAGRLQVVPDHIPLPVPPDA